MIFNYDKASLCLYLQYLQYNTIVTGVQKLLQTLKATV